MTEIMELGREKCRVCGESQGVPAARVTPYGWPCRYCGAEFMVQVKENPLVAENQSFEEEDAEQVRQEGEKEKARRRKKQMAKRMLEKIDWLAIIVIGCFIVLATYGRSWGEPCKVKKPEYVTKWNPMENKFQIVAPGSDLTWNPWSNRWSYQPSHRHPAHIPGDGFDNDFGLDGGDNGY